ncbi:phosphate ABC transporter permease [[Phormidium] sp. LEGE 05292]|uniref:phosphate ABC transporter permease n=1 Tax=[Phormidium] sp. LEGE 05292 TaxID=767427 RepID=UPI001D14107A|nr:phosphate ABC transporter permease [Phormidium sp. LEGE 05292]
MLIPITRQKFEQLIPILATGSQYKYYWGKPTAFILRLLMSLVIAMLIWWIEVTFLGPEYAPLALFSGIFTASYFLWGPIFHASLRNYECRKYKYSGFWKGEIWDLYISEEVVGKEQNVNKRGELVIVENREKRLNIEVGDETGFSTSLQVPLKRIHKSLRRGQVAEMLVMSNKPDLAMINKVTDIYISDLDLWVSDYPYLQRKEFTELSYKFEKSEKMDREKRRRPVEQEIESEERRPVKQPKKPKKVNDW